MLDPLVQGRGAPAHPVAHGAGFLVRLARVVALVALAAAAGAGPAAIAAPVPPPTPHALPPGPPAGADQIGGIIPDGPVTADVMVPHYSPAMEAVSRKLIEAAQQNPKWFQAWVAQHPQGTLPWHPNFGVTRAQYDAYIRSGRTASYEVSYRARLTFERDGRARRWKLHGWGQLAPLDGVVLDVDGGRVFSPRVGALPWLGISQPNEPDVPLQWRWYGVWKAQHEIGDPRTTGQAMVASLHIGPLGDGRNVGLYWVMRRFNRGRRLVDEFLLLRFPARGR
ncbi:MAG TPA: hypothetical protein VMH61_02460 [Candidatus Acidoferrales bacterium]|nr:hypothetical protein [Candidatus Acidoferrales bacterium]